MSCDYRSIKAVPISAIDITSGSKGMYTAIITPLDAERLLRNNKNRRINQNTVLRYALQMERGEWDWCDGDSQLKFGEGGVLRNGQHRLSAQVLANVTGVYDVRTGVPQDSYRVMDSGVVRRSADYFYGREQSNLVSALAKRVLFSSYGYLEPTQSMKALAKRGIPTRTDEIAFAEENYKKLLEYVRQGTRIRNQHKRGSVSAYSCALWISGIDMETIDKFLMAYVDGDDFTNETKETVLKKLVDRNFKPRPYWYGGVTLMAMDAWMDGRGVRLLRLPDVTSRYKRAVEAFSEQTGGDA